VAEMSRTPDFLRRHVGLGRRVRNLETGVHPTTSDTEWFDSTLWTQVPLAPGFMNGHQGINEFPFQYRKRVGVVMFRGGVTNEGGVSAHWPGDPDFPDGGGVKVVGTLPEKFAPDIGQFKIVIVDAPPYRTRAVIQPDGTIEVYDDLAILTSNEQPNVIFDTVSYMPGDHPPTLG
jgi:hypothetical protein